MAMTKAEKARVEELEAALALCWPAYPKPAPMTREEIDASKIEADPRDRTVVRWRTHIALGWFINSYNGDISQGWSDGMYHSRGNITGDNAQQNMGVMYRSKRDAAMALRHEMSAKFAAELAKIDRIVAEDA